MPSFRLAPAIVALALLLCACGEPASTPAVDPAPAPTLPAEEEEGPPRGDAPPPPAADAMPVPAGAHWAPLPAEAPPARLLADARAAEAQGEWVGRDVAGALDLYLAVLAVAPEDAEAAAGRDRGVVALRARFDAAVLAGLEADALSLLAVLAVVDADADLARRERMAALRAALVDVGTGREREAAGQWLAPRGASAVSAFRRAEARLPGFQPALDGLAGIEAALLARARDKAARGDFDDAQRDIERAARVGTGGGAVQDARAELARRRASAAAAELGAVREALDRLDLPRAVASLQRAEAIDPQAAGVDELAGRIALARRYGHFRPGQAFADSLAGGGSGPAMVVLPHGGFTMGAVEGDDEARDNEGPPHDVRFERGVAMAVRETSVAEYRRFVEATGYVTVAERRGRSTVYDERGGAMVELRGADWRRAYDGRRAADDADPVVHLAYADVLAYAEWLSANTGQRYRLPSEAEFEYALRAGARTRWPWGEAVPAGRAPGNLTGDGDRSPQGRRWGRPIRGWSDGAWGPSPVGSYPAEGFGTRDLVGNVSEWVEDCWHDSFRRAPEDGRAWVNPGCTERVVRGGSWASTLEQARASFRLQVPDDLTSARIGFRVVREL